MTSTSTSSSTGSTRSGKKPNWAEFYKNGHPQEVIVIEDDTPPPSAQQVPSSATAHLHGSSPHSNNHHPAMPAHHYITSSPARYTTSGTSSHTLNNIQQVSGHYLPPHMDRSAVAAATAAAVSASGSSTRRTNKRQPSIGLSHTPVTSNGSMHMGHHHRPVDLTYDYPPTTYAPSVSTHSHVAATDMYSPGGGAGAGTSNIPPAKKRRKANPIEPVMSVGMHNSQYYPPPQPLPLQQQLPPPPPSHHSSQQSNGSTRDPPGVVPPPWDDKEGHYIVVPNDDLTSRYKIIRLLGQGTFGKVVECYDRETGKYCAIKIIRAVQKYRDASKIETRVLHTLKRNDPRNIYKCLHLNDCFDYRNHVCMVFDLLGQSIYDWLKDNSFCPFPPNQIQFFAKQLLTSVSFLHRLRLIHTDLKPENILLADGSYKITHYKKSPSKQRRILYNPEIRLIDFGSATFQEEHHSTVVSTRHYRAPEIILGLGWSYPCDIWSIGCILVEFLTGEALFQTHDNLEHLAMMEAVLGPIPEKLIRASHKSSQKYFVNGRLDYPNDETKRNSRKYVKALKKLRDYVTPAGNRVEQLNFAAALVDLLGRLLTYDPAERITAAQALKHPYFNYIVDESGNVLGMKKST
ncbi:dual specificity protein kinase kns1 [Actinomortierella wolfii]|nr:dual specificity protein kinase kns1 [Actinomortierella wolfii]